MPMLFELISPERVVFSGTMRAVMLPGVSGDMTVMPGHEPAVVGLNVGFVIATDVQGHGHRGFVRGGLAQIKGDAVLVLAEHVLPPEELTHESLAQEILHLETIRDASRDDTVRQRADFQLGRLYDMQTTLSF